MQEITTRAETLVPVQEEASVNVKKSFRGKEKSTPSPPISAQCKLEDRRPLTKESSSIGGTDENLTNSNLLVSDENEPKPPISVL